MMKPRRQSILIPCSARNRYDQCIKAALLTDWSVACMSHMPAGAVVRCGQIGISSIQKLARSVDQVKW